MGAKQHLSHLQHPKVPTFQQIAVDALGTRVDIAMLTGNLCVESLPLAVQRSYVEMTLRIYEQLSLLLT